MDFEPIMQALELIERSPRVRRLLWGVVAVLALFGGASFINAARWW